MSDILICKIYKYTNSINNKMYIGQTWNTLEERAGSNGCRYKASEYFYKAIKKYGWGTFTVEVLANCDNQKLADETEIYYIHYYEACNSTKGYNLKDGGSYGKHSDITKKKMSEIKLNLSDVAKQNMSNAHKGIPLSIMHAENIGKALRGHTVSKETKERISKSQIGKILPIEIRRKISSTLTGKRNPSRQKLTDEQMILVLNDKRSNRKIAKDYYVSYQTINRIKNGTRKPNKEGE